MDENAINANSIRFWFLFKMLVVYCRIKLFSDATFLMEALS